LRPLLPFLIMTSLVTSVVIFPIGYQDNYEVVRNVAPFNLSSDSSSLETSENVNLDSGQWSQIGPQLSMEANGVADPQSWAFLTVRAMVYFPPLMGTQLVFSGTFSGLDPASSAIRVFLVLTYLSHVVTLYYLVGDSSIPPDAGSYRYFRITVPSNGTTFSAHRDIVQDLSSVGAGIDVGWEVRSISLGFVIYPSASNVQVPVHLTFNSNQTALSLEGNGMTTSYSSSYKGLYFLAPVTVLAITMFLYICGLDRLRTISSLVKRSFDETG